MEIEKTRQVSKIQVCIRKRPLNKKEIRKGFKDIIDVSDGCLVQIQEPKVKLDMTKYIEKHKFQFDMAFDENQTNLDIYNQTVKSLVDFAIKGGKVSCFAYGQTGSGKTYTMIGKNQTPGIYVLAANDIFDQENNYQNNQVKVSYYEIYCGKMFDLLNSRREVIPREDRNQNIQIVGLKRTQVQNTQQLFELIEKGNTFRVTSQTGKNEKSSRSHAILQMQLGQRKKRGLLSFIDLAGNERGTDTYGHNRQTRKDGAEISKSLLALKECIRALDQDKKHIPFRGSKLTMVLRDSFIGNCRTIMIGNVSPASNNCEYTLNTLRYADRVKELKYQKSHRNKVNELMLPRQKYVAIEQKNKMPMIKPKKKAKNKLIPVKSFLKTNKSLISVKKPLKMPSIKSMSNKKYKLDNVSSSLRQIPNYEKEDGLELEKQHESLINVILDEEEKIIKLHHQHLRKMDSCRKYEEQMIREVDQPGSSIERYIKSLKMMQKHKKESIEQLSNKIKKFENLLNQEQNLSSKIRKNKENLDQSFEIEEDQSLFIQLIKIQYLMDQKHITLVKNLKQKELGDLSQIIESLEAERQFLDCEFSQKLNKEYENHDQINFGVMTNLQSQNALQTDYLQLYTIFGTEDTIWQVLHDQIAKFPQYNKLNRNFEVKMEKEIVNEEKVLIKVDFLTRDKSRLLIPQQNFEEERTTHLRTMINQLSTQLIDLNLQEGFRMDMNIEKCIAMHERHSANKELMKFIGVQFQGKQFLEKNKLFDHLEFMESEKTLSRRQMWNEMIQNKINLTADLFLSLKNSTAVTFPDDTVNVIDQDLIRVVRFYRKEINSVKSLIFSKINQSFQPNQEYTHQMQSSKMYKDLKELLSCFHVFRGDIGYTQCMSRLSFILYSIHRNQIETFVNLSNLLISRSILINFLKFNMKVIDKTVIFFDQLIEKYSPLVHKQIKNINSQMFDIFVPEFIFTIFTSYFEEYDILKAWDCFLCYGTPFIFLLGISIFYSFEMIRVNFVSFEQIKEFTRKKGIIQILKESSKLNLSLIDLDKKYNKIIHNQLWYNFCNLRLLLGYLFYYQTQYNNSLVSQVQFLTISELSSLKILQFTKIYIMS